MSTKKFLQLFGLTIIILISILYLLSLNGKIGEYMEVAYYAIPAFSLLCAGVFFLTKVLERRPNNQILLNLVIINVMFKMFISVAVIATYYTIKNPENGIFVVPFIIVYVGFTIFETYFMSEQARNR